MTREAIIKSKYEEIGVQREEFIMNLGTSHNALKRYNEGNNIYNTLSFPGDKPHAFHLYDNNKLLQKTPERTLAVLDNNPVKKLLEYCIEHTEESMLKLREQDNQWSSNRDHLQNITDKEHLDNATHEADYIDQANWELATANKKNFFVTLLHVLESRNQQKFSSFSSEFGKLGLSESLYEKLFQIADTGSKEQFLNHILSILPDYSWDYLPNIEESIELEDYC